LKSWFRDFAAQASRDLESRYGGIEGKGMRLLLGIYALTVGASQLAFPPGTVRKLIETDDELEVFRIRFDEFLTASIDSLIYGTRRA
jgi:hypothetical protein